MDTIVIRDGEILQKPRDLAEGLAMLQSLNNRSHWVYSGICLAWLEKREFCIEGTEVVFRNWSDEDRRFYLDKHQPWDKAGCYGIQDSGGPVERFLGSYSNVVGFPLRSFFQWHPVWSLALGCANKMP